MTRVGDPTAVWVFKGIRDAPPGMIAALSGYLVNSSG
jgi:hypothetical protein